MLSTAERENTSVEDVWVTEQERCAEYREFVEDENKGKITGSPNCLDNPAANFEEILLSFIGDVPVTSIWSRELRHVLHPLF